MLANIYPEQGSMTKNYLYHNSNSDRTETLKGSGLWSDGKGLPQPPLTSAPPHPSLRTTSMTNQGILPGRRGGTTHAKVLAFLSGDQASDREMNQRKI